MSRTLPTSLLKTNPDELKALTSDCRNRKHVKTNIDPRLTQLNEWIKEMLGITTCSLIPVSGDASFRRYFRFKSDTEQYIAVDAPPEKESNEAFINVTHLLETAGLRVPHIYYCSLDLGFFLLSDFGDTLLAHELNNENANSLYKKAFDALAIIQEIPAGNLPPYNRKLLSDEMELFREWFLHKHLSIDLTDKEQGLLERAFAELTENAVMQPQVFVHRDYHSRNLMQIDAGDLGIVDYQDAMCGPIMYDLVSLLRDCYIDWPPEQVRAWALSYRNQMPNRGAIEDIDEQTFLRWFDLTGIQRHLKAVGIFSRLHIRDGKSDYLRDIPRTLHYIKTIAPNYAETHELANFIQDRVSL